MAGTPPGPRFPLTAFLITWVIGASALLIATNSASKSFGFLKSGREHSIETGAAAP
jgi:hypothetical protein